MAENNSKAVLIFLAIAFALALLAYPLSKFAKKVDTFEYNLSEKQKAAIKTEQELKSQTADLPPETSAPMTPQKNAPQKPMSQEEAKKWKALGSSSGLITERLGRFIDSPDILRETYNNEVMTTAFMERATVKSALSSAKALKGFAVSKEAEQFLASPIIERALSSEIVVEVIAQSLLTEKILQSPALKEILKNPSQAKEFINSVPRLKSIFSKEPVIKALKANPLTKQIV
ncbi:MAG: hypothetical protein NTW04_04385 [Elusimicrobia bacterium]|nr:hypothetical protein [Elusimicrobiota bacterium]